MIQVKMPEAYKIEYLNVPTPDIGHDDVLIEIKRVGICGSDIQIYHGKHKYMSFPIVQGHEASGVITKIGKNVKDFNIGDKVTVQPQVFCGECTPCKMGHFNVCENLEVYGVHTTGMAQEYFAVPASKVVKLPDSMDFDAGAFVEPVAVGVGAIRRCGDVSGKNIVILGAGTIGNLTAQVAKAKGANVMITDINPIKLKIAKECGIDICVNTMEIALGEAIRQQFGEERADIIIDCAAVNASISSAINNARKASKIVIVGNFKQPVEIEMPLIQRQQIDLIGVMMYVREDYLDAIKLMDSGYITISSLISKYFNITEFEEAYQYIDKNGLDVMKVMLEVEDH